MNPMFDALVFWQRLWFEAFWHMPIVEAFQYASMTSHPQDPMTTRFGVLRRYREFSSDYVAARNIDVWMPPGYEETGTGRFPVIYMHDGQNLFDPQSSFIGVDWGI